MQDSRRLTQASPVVIKHIVGKAPQSIAYADGDRPYRNQGINTETKGEATIAEMCQRGGERENAEIKSGQILRRSIVAAYSARTRISQSLSEPERSNQWEEGLSRGNSPGNGPSSHM